MIIIARIFLFLLPLLSKIIIPREDHMQENYKVVNVTTIFVLDTA